jgi:mono/diheme cytochrome c family protein
MLRTLTIAVAALILAAGVADAGSPEKGKALYDGHCASCHGASGNGQGPQAQGMSPVPTDFTNAAAMNARTDSDLQMPILQGKYGTAMPGYGTVLSPDEVESLVLFLRTLAR